MEKSYAYDVALSYATENEELVEKVYYYLKGEGLSVFFAPSREAQIVLSGKNQREIFYSIFGLKSEYVALFVSKNYIIKDTPMEEAQIAFAKHDSGFVIPIYLDDSKLDKSILDPKKINYFESNNAAEIANHIASKINQAKESQKSKIIKNDTKNVMNIKGNTADKQVFIQTVEGSVQL